jgi:hypothetical protein
VIIMRPPRFHHWLLPYALVIVAAAALAVLSA